jgi:hypothetical protein
MAAALRPPATVAATLVLSLAIVAAACGGGAGTVPSQLERPVLSPGGIGPTAIGDQEEEVIAALTELLGSPDKDSGWIASRSEVYGSCPGAEVRAVGWGSFYAILSYDGGLSNDGGAGSGTLSSWTYGFDHDTSLAGVDPWELGLATAEGIGIGSSLAEVRQAYGDRLTEVGNVDVDVWGFSIDGDDPAHLAGRLSGPEADDRVTFLERVPGCEPID